MRAAGRHQRAALRRVPGRRDSGSCRYRATARRHCCRALVVRVVIIAAPIPAVIIRYPRRRTDGGAAVRVHRPDAVVDGGPERTICRRRASPSSASPLCVEHLSHLGPPRVLPQYVGPRVLPRHWACAVDTSTAKATIPKEVGPPSIPESKSWCFITPVRRETSFRGFHGTSVANPLHPDDHDPARLRAGATAVPTPLPWCA